MMQPGLSLPQDGLAGRAAILPKEQGGGVWQTWAVNQEGGGRRGKRRGTGYVARDQIKYNML